MADDLSTRYKEALRLGHVAVAKGRPREAVQHYEEAGRLAGERPLPFISMGSVYLRMRQPQDALRAFDEALERSPNDTEAMRGKVRALEADGKGDEARALAARLTELEAMERAGQSSGAAVDERVLNLERRVAAGFAARARGEPAHAVGAFLAAAHGYAQQNRLDAALEACYRALEVTPGTLDAHMLMAALYLRRGWSELGVERLLLIEQRLSIDLDPRRRARLQALARDHRTIHPELQRLAASTA
jgi:cytochrome c-type biogenesis protein CcmH/NrfG